MPARLRITLAVLVALASVAVVAVALAGGGGSAPRTTAADGFEGALRPPHVPPMDFRLHDQDGRPASLREYRGRVTILTFLYSHCEDTCPLTADQIRGALDEVGHDVPALALSVDPANDTQQSARAFLLDHHLTGRMRFLLGTRAQLEPLWRHYGVAPQGAAFDHSAYVLLIDREGRQRIGFPLSQLTPERLAHDIELLERRR